MARNTANKTSQPKAATRVVAYCRVSTDKQADAGVSLEDQQAKVRAFCQLHDLVLVKVLVDAGVSAKDLNRPSLNETLAMLTNGQADALLVTKLDRLTRSVSDLGTLVENYFASGSKALISVSENIDTRSAAGRLVLNVLGSVSQWEREAIGERTSSAMRHMSESNLYTGGRCKFGFSVGEGGRLVANDDEQRTIETIRSLRSQGLTFRSVAAELTKQGVVSRTGKPFTLAALHKMAASAA